MNLPWDPCHICGCLGHGRAFHYVCRTKWNLKVCGNITKKTSLCLGADFQMTGGFVTQENSPLRKRFLYPSLDCRFLLAWGRRNAGFLLWEPVWSSSLVHLRNQPTTASADTFCSFQLVCLGTDCGNGGCLIKNSHHSVYMELTIKLKKISAYSLISVNLQIHWWQ